MYFVVSTPQSWSNLEPMATRIWQKMQVSPFYWVATCQGVYWPHFVAFGTAPPRIKPATEEDALSLNYRDNFAQCIYISVIIVFISFIYRLLIQLRRPR